MRVKKTQFIFNGIFFALLLLCVLFSNVRAFSYVSLSVYIAYGLYLYHFNKTYFVKYLAFIFGAVGTVVGAVIIELFPEQYLSELRCQSHFSGSLPLLIFSYWVFLYVLEIRENHYRKNIRDIHVDFFSNIKKKVINRFATISCMLLLILFIYVVTHTIPSFLSGIDRFNFGRTYTLPFIISKIYSNMYLLLVFPLLALIYANRLVGVISILSYCVFNLWIGEKFGAFFSLMCILLIVSYNKIINISKKTLRRILLFTIATLLVMIIEAVAIFSFSVNLNPYEYLVQRISQQGQLWWRTYDLYKGKIHYTEFDNEINAFIEGDKPNQESIGAKNGIYKVMYLCAPESVVSAKLARGVRYTQADYAAVYYYFGVFGVAIYSILMGVLVSSVINSFIVSLQKKEYIKAMIYLRFFIIIRVTFSMFTFGGFLSFVSILSYIYLIFTYRKHFKFQFHGNIKIQVSNGRINA